MMKRAGAPRRDDLAVDDDPGADDAGDLVHGMAGGDNDEAASVPYGLLPPSPKKSGPKNPGEDFDDSSIDLDSLPEPKRRRTPGSGRRSGSVNWKSDEIRRFFVTDGKLYQVLADIIAGRPMLAGPTGAVGKASMRYPSLDLRARTAVAVLQKILPDQIFQAVESNVTTTTYSADTPMDRRQLSRAILSALSTGLADEIEGDAVSVAALPDDEREASVGKRARLSRSTSSSDEAVRDADRVSLRSGLAGGPGDPSPSPGSPFTVDAGDEVVAAGDGFVGRDASGMTWAIYTADGRPFEGSIRSKQTAIARAEYLSRTRQLY